MSPRPRMLPTRTQVGRVVVLAVGVALCAPAASAQAPDVPRVVQVSTALVDRAADRYPTGSMVTLDVRLSGPITGTVRARVTSLRAHYESSWLTLQPRPDASQFVGHWDSWGAAPARDYTIRLRLEPATKAAIETAGPTLNLVAEPMMEALTAASVDAEAFEPHLGAQVLRTHNAYRRSYNGPLGYGWTHNYAVSLRALPDGVVKVFEARGQTSWYIRDSSGTYRSRPGDQATVSRLPDGTFLRTHRGGRIEVFSAEGMLTALKDQYGNTVQLSYDSLHRLDAVTTFAGERLRFHYAADNRIEAIDSPGGRRTTYQYDTAGNLVAVSRYGVGAVRYEYDRDHSLVRVAEPNGRVVRLVYDGTGRLMLRQDSRGGSFGYEFDDDRQVVVITDAAGARTQFQFDIFNNISAIVDHAGNRATFAFDSSNALSELVDAAGNRRQFRYTPQGDLAAIVDPAGAETSIAYDTVSSRPIAVTDALSHVTAYRYDEHGNRVSVAYADGSVERFSWNADGSLKAHTDRAGHVTAREYDSRGRLASLRTEDGVVEFAYDDANNLAAVREGARELRYEYNVAGRVTAVHDSRGYTLRYEYDAAGQRVARRGPSGVEIHYRYSNGRLVALQDKNGSTLVEYTYDPAGRLVAVRTGNGVETRYRYDAMSRLVELRAVNQNGDRVAFEEYEYDSLNNRTAVRTEAGTRRYAYDSRSSLVSTTYPDGHTERFSYDRTGVRSAVWRDDQSTAYAVNAVGQPVSAGTIKYDYDRDGNRTSDGRSTYQYDARHRLVRVVAPNDRVTFRYDPFGRRQEKTSAAGRMSYVWDGFNLAADVADDGKLRAEYVYGEGADELVAIRHEGETRYVIRDGLGNVVALTDDAGRRVEQYDYESFGATTPKAGAGYRHLFAGREFDGETGLYYFRARYYDPSTGLFMSPEPAGWTLGADAYQYAYNNPASYKDPLGLSAVASSFDVGGSSESVVDAPVLSHTLFQASPGGAPPVGGPEAGAAPSAGLCGYGADRLGNLFEVPVPTLCGAGSSVVSAFAQVFLREGFGEAFGGSLRDTTTKAQVAAGDPTFVQPSIENPPAQRLQAASSAVVARIDFPRARSLVRGKVPVFGLAYGEGFAEYRLEYGEGTVPTTWTLIGRSADPQTRQVTPNELTASPDVTVHGSLGTWDTGLKSYVYLPEYPADHAVNLNGTYTIRLTVVDRDGRTTEDRVVLQVGEAIPNAWGGTVTSADLRARLVVAPHSLSSAFRVIALRPVPGAEREPQLQPASFGMRYEVREPGEKLRTAANLELAVPDAAMTEPRLAVCAWNREASRWLPLPTVNAAPGWLRTQVTRLAPFYVICQGTTSAAPPFTPSADVLSRRGYYLTDDSFEDNSIRWAVGDGAEGTALSIDRSTTGDGGAALKVSTTGSPDGLYVTMFGIPFDARDYPLVRFDYMMAERLPADIFASVHGRWYQIRWSGDGQTFAHQRVNVAGVGEAPTPLPDSRWHHVEFNLLEMLRTATGETQVDRVVLAGLSVAGYMKLEPTRQQQGRSIFVDNFQIVRTTEPTTDFQTSRLVIDDFNKDSETNRLGQGARLFSDSDASLGNRTELAFANGATGAGRALDLSYDLGEPGSFAGYLTALPRLDLTPYRTLSFALFGVPKHGRLVVGLRDNRGAEGKITLSQPVSTKDGWARYAVPLVGFSGVSRAAVAGVILAVERGSEPDSGHLLIDDLVLDADSSTIAIDDFGGDGTTNRLGGANRTFTRGAAAISAGPSGSEAHALRLSFGGSIGETLTYGAWESDLRGLNIRGCSAISFRVKGQAGGEPVSLYLDDGATRWGFVVDDALRVTKNWQHVVVPLSVFSGGGVDLTHIAAVQFVFEWKPVSGTIYVADLAVECGASGRTAGAAPEETTSASNTAESGRVSVALGAGR